MNLVGSSVTENSLIQLPSGSLSIDATGANGGVTIGGTLDASGTAQSFNDLVKYTSGGRISLTSDSGSVVVHPGGVVTVAAKAGGGDAGSVAVSAANGLFTSTGGSISGEAGAGGQGGSFSLDVASIPGGSVQPLDAILNAGGFTQTISIRDRTDAGVTVDGTVKAATYDLAADQGSITVTGTIDVSNVAATDPSGNAIQVGGTIDLDAYGSVTLASGSVLTVRGPELQQCRQGWGDYLGGRLRYQRWFQHERLRRYPRRFEDRPFGGRRHRRQCRRR